MKIIDLSFAIFNLVEPLQCLIILLYLVHPFQLSLQVNDIKHKLTLIEFVCAIICIYIETVMITKNDTMTQQRCISDIVIDTKYSSITDNTTYVPNNRKYWLGLIY